VSPPVLIIGNGPCAGIAAEHLLRNGFKIHLVSAGPSPPVSEEAGEKTGAALEMLPHTRLSACQGTIGNFKLKLDQQGQTVFRQAHFILVAEEISRKPNFSIYGLKPSPWVLPLSRFTTAQVLRADKKKPEFKVAYLFGLAQEGTPSAMETIMQHCLRLHRRSGCQTYVLTRNLKVAADGLEQLYRETKKAGTIYIKFDLSKPLIRQDQTGRINIAFTDESIRQRFSFRPDLTVVDETARPSDDLAAVAEILNLEKNPAGFLQADNVRRKGLETNRRGIWAAGSSRGLEAERVRAIDAATAVMTAMKSCRAITAGQAPDVKIYADKCIHCLSCYRVCPHRAVSLDTEPRIDPDACEQCGLCAAECPRHAVSLQVHPASAEAIHSVSRKPRAPKNIFSPHLMVFCCRRSAGEAIRSALRNGATLPPDTCVRTFPCAGAVSLEHIYGAYRQGADGVLVLTCHAGNCHSGNGNGWASNRVDQIQSFFQHTAFEPQRLQLRSLAANMEAEWARLIINFEKQVRALGPSRLK